MKTGFGSLTVPAFTAVANEFIDRYMPSANGEYVKVYLYLLRHAGEDISSAEIAEALDLTERDVKRALQRWQKEGILQEMEGTPDQENKAAAAAVSKEPAAASEPDAYAVPAEKVPAAKKTDTEMPAELPYEKADTEETAAPAPQEEMVTGIPDRSEIDFVKLRSNDEFTSLMYVVQRYLSRIFSQTDSETIAYLYDVLKMPAELIEYLAERCAQNGKTSLRYFESIALDWYRRGIRTVEDAQRDGNRYSADVYAVMKAFGIGSREPGSSELAYIKKWFSQQGFSRELVLEACSRTLEAAQKPSFRYADSILERWYGEKVRSMADLAVLDAEHERRVNASKNARPVQGQGQYGTKRFHNLDERSDDLDDFVQNEMRKKLSGI